MGGRGPEFNAGMGQDARTNIKSELPPIPEESVDGWKKIPVLESGEHLVPIGAFSGFSDCDTSAVYFGERGQGSAVNFLGEPVDRDVSLITHFVRAQVLNRLAMAQSTLPKGYYFKFLDNYRPLEVQQALFDAQKTKFRTQHPEWTGEQLDEETQTYVSLPSPNKDRGTTHPSPHSTGGVVDLTIIRLSDEGQGLLQELKDKELSGELKYPISKDEQGEYQEVVDWINEQAKTKHLSANQRQQILDNWLERYRYARAKAKIFKTQSKELDMGTGFDHFGPEAGTRYFEELAQNGNVTEEQQTALRDRRFLYKTMRQAGFSNYPEEWWHWSFGDNMDAANRGKDHAIYGTAQMSEENKMIEWARKGVYEDASERTGNKELFGDSIEEDPSAE